MVKASYGISNLAEFREALANAKRSVDDLTEPLNAIANDWFKSERGSFSYAGPGPYRDLTRRYKAEKKRSVGAVYPILVRSGRLRRSMTDRSSGDAVGTVENKKVLVLDSRVPYARFVQDYRPFFFIGPEAPQYATAEQAARPERWRKILNAYVLRQMGFSLGRAA
jgi:hypothetical protein